MYIFQIFVFHFQIFNRDYYLSLPPTYQNGRPIEILIYLFFILREFLLFNTELSFLFYLFSIFLLNLILHLIYFILHLFVVQFMLQFLFLFLFFQHFFHFISFFIHSKLVAKPSI